MKTFTIISWLLSIIFWFLWFQNAFPAYSNYIIYSSFIWIWLFLWLIISIFDKKINIQIYKISSTYIFVYSFYLGILIIALILLLLYPDNFLKIIWGIWFFTIFTFSHVLWLISNNWITISERKFLADKYEKEWNYSEALGHYYKMLEGMKEEDERYKWIKDKISELRKKQIL